MPSCMHCKTQVISGLVLCRHCAKSLEPHTLSPELSFVLDQLAEKIVLDEKIYPCAMCVRGSCPGQVSGLVCRSSVKQWLVDHAQTWLSRLGMEGADRR